MPAPPSVKNIRVGHSPDPDDAFMFYALAKQKIPMQGFQVEHVIEDIETLNQRALRGELEVTAVSCHAYAYLAESYVILRSGASVGDNYGPILIGRGEEKITSLKGKKIAIPGKLTTAYLALQLYDADFEPLFIPFDKILDAVLSGEADLGLVIHEGQITYQEKGLSKLMDLGQWWQEKTKLPLPLGIDIIRRDLGKDSIEAFAKLLKQSIVYALQHRSEALDYALEYGRGLSKPLGDQFVGMYVNDYTVDLGLKGERGLARLLDAAYDKGLLPKRILLEFVG
ncbi:MAG: ABC transporter substrate-binding protein [Candidatus Omnitrophica bacterium]|nr:ABC transporter substrate-binding protein [Candidatus Omnitrophota bacterium]